MTKIFISWEIIVLNSFDVSMVWFSYSSHTFMYVQNVSEIKQIKL